MTTDHPTSAKANGPGKVLMACGVVDAWLLFFSRALSRAGYDVTIVTHIEPLSENHDHSDIMKYFLPKPFCQLVDVRDAATLSGNRYDFALTGMRGTTTPDDKRKILDLIGATPLRAVVLRQYDSRYPAMTKLLLKEIQHPFLRRSARVMVEEYIGASWMLCFLSSTHQLGAVPHQRVICQGLPEGLSDQIERPYLFNFLGSFSGPRVPVVKRLEAQLQITQGGEQLVKIADQPVRMMWHADRTDSTRPRPLNEYLDTLGNSFFTLCLPGYEVITHRALEAMHCGSIPVLPAESIPHYLLPLEHGRNCWAVHNNEWELAMSTLLALDHEKVLAMQNAVKKLAREEASISALEKKYLELLGLKAD